MENLIRAFLSVATLWLIGHACVLLMFRGNAIQKKSPVFVFGLGLGFGLLAEYSIISLSLTRHVDFRFVYAAIAVAISVILYKNFRSGFSHFFGQSYTRKRDKSDKSVSIKIVRGTGKSLVAVVVLLVAALLLSRPMYQFDSRAIWGLKAKVLFHEQTIFSERVMDISSNHPHPRYPLLVPLASAWIFENMGVADDRAVRFLFLSFFLGLIAAAYRLPQKRRNDIGGFLSVCLLLAAPYVYGSKSNGAASGYADIPLAFYIAASTLAMVLWIREKNLVHAFMSALLAAFAVLTKNEGLVFALNLFLSAVIFSVMEKRGSNHKDSTEVPPSDWLRVRVQAFHGLAVYAAVLTITILPWLLVRANLPSFLDENYAQHLNWKEISMGLSRLPTVLKAFAAELLNIRNWGLAWPLAIASGCAAWKNGDKESRFISTVVALQIVSYAAIFLITPNDYAGQMRVSLSRLLLHVLPLAAALVSMQAVDGVRIMDKD